MTADSRVDAGDGARGKKLVHLQNVICLGKVFKKFIYNHLSEGIYTCTKGSFHFISWDPRVRAWGGVRGQNLVHPKRIPYLDSHLSYAFILVQ